MLATNLLLVLKYNDHFCQHQQQWQCVSAQVRIKKKCNICPKSYAVLPAETIHGDKQSITSLTTHMVTIKQVSQKIVDTQTEAREHVPPAAHQGGESLHLVIYT